MVEAATEILEQYGLADLSMRRVATRLGVQPSALYWHVRDKQSLLALVADRLLDGVVFSAPLPEWRAELRARAVTLHGALLSTRDAAELVASVVALDIGGQRFRALIAEPVPRSLTGLNYRENAGGDIVADTLVDGVCSLLLGHAVISQQRAQAIEFEAGGTSPRPIAEFSAMLDLLLVG
ncbi:TetR family transcriptional regulator [Nesterenkonia sp. AY15]|nr:TetR family transcriptional regulator [Nesterenkonia sp. AY15]